MHSKTFGQKQHRYFAFSIISNAGGNGCGIMEDRQPIMHIIRSLVYNRNEVDLELQYKGLLKATSPDSYTVKYSQLVSRLESFWERRSE